MANGTLSNGLQLRGQIWHMRFKLKGILVTESTHTSNKREAERILAKRKSDMVQDMVLDSKRPSNLHYAIDQFVTTRNTAGAKRNALYSLQHFKDGIGDKHLKKVERHEVQQVVEGEKDKGHKLSTIALRINYWNTFVNWCDEQKYHAPPKINTIKGVQHRTRWLTVEEQTRLLNALNPNQSYNAKSDTKDAQKQDNYDLIVMLLDTGVRFMEAASMHWNQVDLDGGHIYVDRKKKGQHTTLSITNRLKQVLLRRKALHPNLIFPTKDGVNRSAHWMKAAVKRAGISTAKGNITPHVMRHTFATTMLQNGMSLSDVKHLLGHTNIAMTERYAHIIKQDSAVKSADILNKLNQPSPANGATHLGGAESAQPHEN